MKRIAPPLEYKNHLRYRWVGHEEKLKELISIIQIDANWHKSEVYRTLMNEVEPPFGSEVHRTLMNKVGPSLEKLLERDLMGAPLSGAELYNASLAGANLFEGDLSKAELAGADLSRAGLIGANLSGANLLKANLSGANLSMAIFTDATLMETDLSGANLVIVDLKGAHLLNARYTTGEVMDRLITWVVPRVFRRIPFVRRLKKWQSRGITQFAFIDTSQITTNPALKRHIEDFQFIMGFKNKSWLHRRLFYPLWKITSDCGRSLLLWLMWSILFVGSFTWIYSWNLKTWFRQPDLDWFNALYLSVVTFTTLGFGDVSPNLASRTAQVLVMAQVIIGYIMLGGLISILANKLARRA